MKEQNKSRKSITELAEKAELMSVFSPEGEMMIERGKVPWEAGSRFRPGAFLKNEMNRDPKLAEAIRDLKSEDVQDIRRRIQGSRSSTG